MLLWRKFTAAGRNKIYSNLEAGVTRVQDLDMGFENIFPEYRFVETHYYELYQYRISELAYEYFRKLRLVSEQNGTIFDPIPASVTSNVYNVNNPKEKSVGFLPGIFSRGDKEAVGCCRFRWFIPFT